MMVLRTRAAPGAARIPAAVLALLLASASVSGAQGSVRLAAQTLAGAPRVIPVDLEGTVDILVIGFSQKAGTAARPWAERLSADFPASGGSAVYEVAVLAGVPAWFRPLALAATRASTAPVDRSRLLVALTDLQSWKDLAGGEAADEPCVVVIDRRGSVLARTRGDYQQGRYDEISAAIRAAMGRN